MNTYNIYKNYSVWIPEIQCRVILALLFITEFSQEQFVIYTDSLSSLKSLQSTSQRNPFLQLLIIPYMETRNHDEDIVFCWVPSHVGIRGNDNSDLAAKGAINLDISKMQVP